MKKSMYQYNNFVGLNMAEVEDFIHIYDCGYWDCEAIKVDADVYGLTVATVSVINVAKNLGYKQIALKHYNRDNGLYECQWVY